MKTVRLVYWEQDGVSPSINMHGCTAPCDWRSWLVDDTASVIPEDEIQLARLTGRG